MTQSTSENPMTPDPARTSDIVRHGARITINGRLEFTSHCDALKQCAEDAIEELGANQPELVIDVAGAEYLYTRALATLTTIARLCANRGVKLVLEHANADLVELLRITHIDRVLELRGVRIAGGAS